jgi:hypothetical protein
VALRNEIETAAQRPDQVLVITRVFDAPRALVFKLCTDSNHAMKWWGPRDYPATCWIWTSAEEARSAAACGRPKPTRNSGREAYFATLLRPIAWSLPFLGTKKASAALKLW